MKIAVVHDTVPGSSAPDVRDVIAQAEAVEGALAALGHESCRLACSLDLAGIQKELMASGAECVFNLVESIEGKGRLIHLFPFCLDALAIPYTGARAEALMLTSNKITAKERMAAAGIPTPRWIGAGPRNNPRETDAFQEGGSWIIKSQWEHASIGLDRESVVHGASIALLRSMLRSKGTSLGGQCFAESFIEGREFNLSLLAGSDGPEILPPAEILFEGYSEDMPRILDYRAKWDDSTYEYHHTRRRFRFQESDQNLLNTLKSLAICCWEQFGLSGYARVDFRVDLMGNPWVLEVNANPCLSPDAGFAATLEQAGIPFARAVERIVAAMNAITGEPCEKRSVGNRMFDGSGQMMNTPEPLTDMILEGECKTRVPPERRHVLADTIEGVVLRAQALPRDVGRIRQLVERTGFFSPQEVDVAGELVAERLAKGCESGYEFVMADHEMGLMGYVCYGLIPCTGSSYDLYWIAVHPDFQGQRLGRRLLGEAEKRIRASGGTQIYVDTSHRLQYAGTRRFYEGCGYRLKAVLEDFYGDGDGKAIYCKSLA